MWKHHTSKHREEEEISFSMKIIKQHRSSFSRQMHDAVLIEMMDSEAVDILNSKGGFNRCSIPRLSVMLEDREQQERPSAKPEITRRWKLSSQREEGEREWGRQRTTRPLLLIKGGTSWETLALRDDWERPGAGARRWRRVWRSFNREILPFSLQFQANSKLNGLQRGSILGSRSKVTTGHPP